MLNCRDTPSLKGSDAMARLNICTRKPVTTRRPPDNSNKIETNAAPLLTLDAH